MWRTAEFLITSSLVATIACRVHGQQSELDARLSDRQLEAVVQELSARLKGTDVELRKKSVEQLDKLCEQYGDRAGSAISLLVDALGDDDESIRESASWKLKDYHSLAEPHLIRCLSSDRELIRKMAAKSLTGMPQLGAKAVSALRQALADSAADVRLQAALALGSSGSGDAITRAKLLELGKSEVASDRAAALGGLSLLSPSLLDKSITREWLDFTVKSIEDKDVAVRSRAFHALEYVELPDDKKVSLYLKGLSDLEISVAEGCLWNISNLIDSGVDFSPAVKPLCEIIRRSGDEVYSLDNAVDLLGKIGPPAKESIPDLIPLLEHKKASIVCSAAEALWKIDKRTKESLPALKRLLQDNELGAAEAACGVIYQIGPAAAPLAPDLIKALGSDDWDLQWAAADALGALGTSDPDVVRALLDALDHRSGIVQNAAKVALSKIGKESVPLLVEALAKDPPRNGSIFGALRRALLGNEDPPLDRREWIADALGEMGDDAEAAVEPLKKLLKHKDQNLRAWSAIAIGKINGSTEVVPQLIEIIESEPGDNIRAKTAEALANVGPPAKDAIPSLKRLTRSANEVVRDAATTALEKIKGKSP